MKRRNDKNILNREECLEIIKKKINQEFRLIDYNTISIDSTLGFMGRYFKLKATVSLKKLKDNNFRNDKYIKTLNYFIKIPPLSNTTSYDYNEEQGSFTKEVDLYNKVFPKLFNGANENIPICFLALHNDIIVMEDMASKGYIMPNKMTPFDIDHCKILMESLAKFHSKSIIFEEIHGINLFEEFSYCMHETLWPMREGLSKKMFNAAVKGVISLVDMIDEIDQSNKNQLKEKLLLLSETHLEKLLPSEKYKNVLCHGDLWANNILFKYNSNGKPTSCCFIDFQLVRYNPPVHDIMTCLQFTTCKDVRTKHIDNLIEIYYENVKNLVMQEGLDLARVFSREEFLQSFQSYRIIYMIHGILNTPIMLLESGAVEKYFTDDSQLKSLLYHDRTPLIHQQFQTNLTYRERLTDAIIELHEWLNIQEKEKK